jgi:hypothetical protein
VCEANHDDEHAHVNLLQVERLGSISAAWDRFSGTHRMPAFSILATVRESCQIDDDKRTSLSCAAAVACGTPQQADVCKVASCQLFGSRSVTFLASYWLVRLRGNSELFRSRLQCWNASDPTGMQLP